MFTGRGVELGRALRIPTGEGFGIATQVGGQRSGSTRRILVRGVLMSPGFVLRRPIGNGAYRRMR
jgi:hypothetical protein